LLKLPDVICDLKAATFPALTPEVAESCLREYFNNWIMKKYDDCELLANRYFSTLENSGGSDAIFFHSLEILRYTGKISKFAKSDDFKHFSSIMKSVYPGYNFMVNVVGWVTFSYSSSCGVILNHLPPFFFLLFFLEWRSNCITLIRGRTTMPSQILRPSVIFLTQLLPGKTRYLSLVNLNMIFRYFNKF